MNQLGVTRWNSCSSLLFYAFFNLLRSYMVTNLSSSNTVLSEWVREIRDVSVQDDRMRFRRNMERIGEIAAYEISKLFQDG